MMMNLYVGNLPYSTTEENLREAFAAFGEVQTVKPDHRQVLRPVQGLRLCGNGRQLGSRRCNQGSE